MNEKVSGIPHSGSASRLDKHKTARYRIDLGEHYGNDIEMRDLELCKQGELDIDDTAVENFKELFTFSVSGNRIAEWLQIIEDKVRPDLTPEYIDGAHGTCTLPYMTRTGNLGRIVLHNDYVYTYQEDSDGKTIMMAGLALTPRDRFDPAVQAPIEVVTITLIGGELTQDVPEDPISLTQGHELLMVKPFSPPGEHLTTILTRLDEALDFLSQEQI